MLLSYIFYLQTKCGLQFKRGPELDRSYAEGAVVGVGVNAVEDSVGVVGPVQEIVKFEAED